MRAPNEGVKTTDGEALHHRDLPIRCLLQRVASGRLHPRVGHDDPQRAEMRAEDDKRGGEEPEARAEAAAAEEHQAQETALQEEGEDALGGQQTPKDVADEARIARPVHAELEFLHDAGGDAHGEDEAVDLEPVERELAPLLLFRAHVEHAEDHEDDAKSHRDGRVDVVEADRQSELDP